MKQIKPIEVAYKYKPLTSLNGTEYELLLSVFDKGVKEKQKQYTLKVKRRIRLVHQEQQNSSLHGSRQKLEFVLILLRYKSYMIDYQFITEKEVKL